MRRLPPQTWRGHLHGSDHQMSPLRGVQHPEGREPPHQRAAERRTLKGKPVTTTAKQTPPPRRQGENGFKYKPQFGLVVPCKDEDQQRRIYARLVKLGMTPKVVCV